MQYFVFGHKAQGFGGFDSRCFSLPVLRKAGCLLKKGALVIPEELPIKKVLSQGDFDVAAELEIWIAKLLERNAGVFYGKDRNGRARFIITFVKNLVALTI